MRDADLEDLRQAAAHLDAWVSQADLSRPTLGEAPDVQGGQGPTFRAEPERPGTNQDAEAQPELRPDLPTGNAPSREESPSLRPPLQPEFAAAESPPPGAGLRLPLPVAEQERPSLGEPAASSPESLELRGPTVLGMPPTPEGRPSLGREPQDFAPPASPPALGQPPEAFGTGRGQDALQESLEDLTDSVDKLREALERDKAKSDKPSGPLVKGPNENIVTLGTKAFGGPDPPKSGGSSPSVMGTIKSALGM